MALQRLLELFQLIVAWQAATKAVFAYMLIVVCVKSKASSGSFA